MAWVPKRIEPGPGQESVWDYPRPPRVEETTDRIRVVVGGATVADTTHALRVLETSQPPAFYLPPADVDLERLQPSTTLTFCEWKGLAHHASIAVGDRLVADAAWTYPDPTPGFEAIRDHWAFYAQKADACFVGEEQVEANEGSFYGGWITGAVVGPFKGGAGSAGLVIIRALSVFEGVVYHCSVVDPERPCRPTLEVEAVLRDGDADAGPILLSVADYVALAGGIEVARPCLEDLATKGRITSFLGVDHLVFPFWTPVDIEGPRPRQEGDDALS